MFVVRFLIGVLVVVLLGIVGLVCLKIYYERKHAQYFQKKNVPYIATGMWDLIQIFGGKLSLPDAEDSIYQEVVRLKAPLVAGYSDMFVTPAFYIMDLDLARHIYVKDFDHFANRKHISNPSEHSQEILHKMLINLDNDEWKGMRSKLSPTFTTGKIRRMYSIFDRSSQRMCQYLRKQVGSSGKDYDICEVYSKFALDVIASCAFGIDSQSFEYPPGVQGEFETMCQAFQFRFDFSLLFKFVALLIAPNLAAKWGISVMDERSQDYFRKMINEVLKARRTSGERKDDFLQLMMDAQEGLLKNEENSKETLEVMTGTEGDETKNASITSDTSIGKLKFDDEAIVANSALFLLAGFDTLQSVLIYAAHILAVEQEVQEKLLQEIETRMESTNGKLTYDDISQMTYLDMVINETLRFLPPATRTERLCTKDYKVPGTDIVIEKGNAVALPVYAMQRDPRYYKNPLKFDPERFLPENKSARHPYAFAPFGHGPRNCIGMRFALTEVKSVIVTLIHNFKLEPCSKTDIPPKFGNSGTLKPANGMWLNIQPRHQK